MRAVLSGGLDRPKLAGALANDPGTVGQLQLLIANARAGTVGKEPDLPISNVAASSGAEAADRTDTAQIAQTILFILTLMLSTKGIAAVPRASLVVLAGTLAQFGLPLEGIAVILGVDELMDMARTATNVVGNCLATAVVARWEGEFNEKGNEFVAPIDASTINLH